MNSAAVKDPELVTRAAGGFGKETVCVAIDGRRNPTLPSGFEVVVAGGTKGTGLDCGEWARRCQELGAGVILPTSMDGDGTLAAWPIRSGGIRRGSPRAVVRTGWGVRADSAMGLKMASRLLKRPFCSHHGAEMESNPTGFP